MIIIYFYLLGSKQKDQITTRQMQPHSLSVSYLMSFDEHQAHDEVFADVLRLGQTDSFQQPCLFLLAVLQELVKLQRSLQGGPPHLRQVVNTGHKHPPYSSSPTPSAVVWVGFATAFVCLSVCPHGISNTTAARITKLDAVMFRHKLW